jgi:hypothetical protein
MLRAARKCSTASLGNKKEKNTYDDSLEGKMAADPLKNKKMLNKSTNFCSKSFFWCTRCKSVDR